MRIMVVWLVVVAAGEGGGAEASEWVAKDSSRMTNDECHPPTLGSFGAAGMTKEFRMTNAKGMVFFCFAAMRSIPRSAPRIPHFREAFTACLSSGGGPIRRRGRR